MDMIGKIETQPLKAAELLAAMDLCEAAGEMSPIEIAATRRVIRLLEAAEKMADAIDAAEDSRYPMTDAAKAAWEFRKAMRGEL